MNTRRLRVIGGAGDPDSAPALRVDVLRAVTAYVAAVDSTKLTTVEYAVEVEKASDAVYRAGTRWLKACGRRQE